MHEIKRRQNVADNELDEVVKSTVEQVSLYFLWSRVLAT